MFGISGEHLIILGIVLLFFGPRRLPELGHTLGKAMKNFKDAVSGVEEAGFRRLGATGPDQKASESALKKDSAGLALAEQSPKPVEGQEVKSSTGEHQVTHI